MSDIQQQINDRIEAFIADISDLARRAAMETLQNSLDGGLSTPPARRQSAPAATRSDNRRKGGKRSPEEISGLADSLYTYIDANPGQRMEDIAKAMSSTSKDLTLPLKKLQAEGKITVQGQKRATSYYASGNKGTASKARKPRRGRKKSR